MRIRRFHRTIGIILLLPLLGWAITGLIFFIKPGYGGAYETLVPKTYPLAQYSPIAPLADWLEYRCLRTVLGDHLIARTTLGWVHLNPADLQSRSTPATEDIRRLMTDAISVNPQRYGRIVQVAGLTALTDTNVEIKLDWTRLTLQQSGRDTRRIDLLYRIHYLQWTGIKSLDNVLGLLGLTLVLALTVLGARLAIRPN